MRQQAHGDALWLTVPLSRCAAGHLPINAQGVLTTGKVGSELTTEQGYDAARLVGLNIMGTLKGAC